MTCGDGFLASKSTCLSPMSTAVEVTATADGMYPFVNTLVKEQSGVLWLYYAI